VKGLNPGTTKKQFRTLFEPYGKILSITLPKEDRDSKFKPKFCGLVFFENHEQAQQAFNAHKKKFTFVWKKLQIPEQQP